MWQAATANARAAARLGSGRRLPCLNQSSPVYQLTATRTRRNISTSQSVLSTSSSGNSTINSSAQNEVPASNNNNKLGEEVATSRTRQALKEHNTNFGFEKVSEEHKQARVKEVFNSVASNYDLMNDVSSLGIHRCWKDHLIERIRPVPGLELLDVAGGTGDIAMRFLKHAKINGLRLGIRSEKPTKAVVCDINPAMLAAGRSRPGVSSVPGELSWVEGNAEQMPFEADSFDVVTMGFGIRNVTHIDRVLVEARRVLRPGGRFLCLEFSQVENPLFSKIYDLYSFQVIPVMGQILAGDWRSYQYLVESIRKFPSQPVFANMIRDAGFKCVTYENLFNGVAAIHVGFKL